MTKSLGFIWMGRRLQTLKPRVASVSTQTAKPLTTTSRRMTGRKLQSRRLTLWTQDPTCAKCKRIVLYPHGFELDHIVPLWEGGSDDVDNLQILCVWTDEQGEKRGCHADKTATEAGERG